METYFRLLIHLHRYVFDLLLVSSPQWDPQHELFLIFLVFLRNGGCLGWGGYVCMPPASRFCFSFKVCKQGSREIVPITAYLGAPTSDLLLLAADSICPLETGRWHRKIRAHPGLDETG